MSFFFKIFSVYILRYFENRVEGIDV